MLSRVPWRTEDELLNVNEITTVSQVDREWDQTLRFQQRRAKMKKKKLGRDTTVVIQNVFTDCDVNVAQLLKQRLQDDNEMLQQALTRRVDLMTADATTLVLKRVELLRARKPTASMRSIARSATTSILEKAQAEMKRLMGSGCAQRVE